jgi:photosystem II Psb27 protein
MSIKSSLSRLLALALAIVVCLMGCGATPSGLTGKYTEDTTVVLQNLLTAIDLPADAANKAEAQKLARQQINDYTSMYRRNSQYSGLRSFTTMQTAVNSLAGFYSSYGGRPLPDKLKQRLKQEFKQVEVAIQRGA